MKNKEVEPSLTGSRFRRAEASPGFLFWRAFNEWSRALRAELDKIGLTQAQYSILAAVSYLGSSGEPISQQDVANQLSMDKMMVSDVTKKLVAMKLLVRKAHPRDGRSVSLGLTTAATRLLKTAVPLVEGVDERFFGRLPADELRKFQQLLITLTDPE